MKNVATTIEKPLTTISYPGQLSANISPQEYGKRRDNYRDAATCNLSFCRYQRLVLHTSINHVARTVKRPLFLTTYPNSYQQLPLQKNVECTVIAIERLLLLISHTDSY
jgi:hypothetical protein